MKVYIIEYDNCEMYEDHQKWIGEVFRDKETAEKFLLTNGFIENTEYYDTEYVKETIINNVPVSATGANILKRDLM